MDNADDLRQKLTSIDGEGYKAYKGIEGRYSYPGADDRGPRFQLIVDHVQGDPYAAPSKVRVVVPQEVAGFPRDTYRTPHPSAPSRSREVALRDWLTRRFGRAAGRASRDRGTGKSGLIAVDEPGQQILERSSAFVDPEEVELRLVVGLPARGRRVLGRQASEMLCDDLPGLVRESSIFGNLDADELYRHVETAEDADRLRELLPERGLVAFVADGAVLPRRSGIDDRPLETGAVPFRSPDSLRVGFDLPNRGRVTGMGVPEGVTLIVGGGYHGKSTLLSALMLGVYDHVPGDGRELVVTDPAAVKIRAEDGRRVRRVDISPFIGELPGGGDTRDFSTDDASGSTSQAANIVEALELGGRVLLIDEDTSATNFMIRDHRMQVLIARDREPITPFIDRVRPLHEQLGVSTILVMGGSGDYFDVADTIITMDEYLPHDVTGEARRVARDNPTGRESESGGRLEPTRRRAPVPDSVDPSRGRRSVKLRVRDVDEIEFGTEEIDLSGVEQIVDRSQSRAIAEALVWAKRRAMDGELPLSEVVDRVMEEIEAEGLGVLSPYRPGDLARFRRFELAAAFNRLRTAEVGRAEGSASP